MNPFKGHKVLLGVIIGAVLYELYDRKVAGSGGAPKLS